MLRPVAAADAVRDGRAEGPARSSSTCSANELGAAWETAIGHGSPSEGRPGRSGSAVVDVGGDAPISVQSMTTTKTADVNATLQQIASLVAAGVDIVRVAVPALGGRRGARRRSPRRPPCPVVADIHFQWKYAMAALEAGHPGAADQPGQHQVPGQGPADRARGEGARRARSGSGSTRARSRRTCWASTARPPPRRSSRSRAERGADPRGRGLLRHQDQREALEPARDDRGVPAAGGEVRLPAAPRRHRGRADADGRREERGRDRHAARRGHRRHDPRVASPTIPSRRSRSAHAILQSLGLRKRGLDLVACPVVRPRGGRTSSS